MNSVVLIGRLTRDPEIRYISESQMAVATFTVAIDRPVRSGQEKKTDFPRVTVFGRQAENCERFLAKGRLVGVQGRIQTGSYTNKDGVTVYTTDVVADRVEFLEWGDRNERAGGGYQNQGRSQQPSKQEPADRDMGVPEGPSGRRHPILRDPAPDDRRRCLYTACGAVNTEKGDLSWIIRDAVACEERKFASSALIRPRP